ncbi:MAG: hypothetical protein GY711_11190 [bacterium]|nr:hypothetical protein [bacterium]
MHSWVFRNRARLRALYGVRDEPRPAPAMPTPPGAPAAGTIIRSPDGVVLTPMRRRAV